MIPDSLLPKLAKGYRARLAQLAKIGPLLHMGWVTSPVLLSAVIGLRLIRSFLPVATLWVAKLILDAVVSILVRHGGSVAHLWKLVGLECFLSMITGIIGRASGYSGGVFSDRLNNRVSARMMEHAATLDMISIEDPVFQDRLERARRHAGGRIKVLTSLMNISQDLISLVLFSVGLLAFSPWLICLLALAVVPGFMGEAHFSKLAYAVGVRRTPQRRFLDYLRFLAVNQMTFKEVKFFELGEHLVRMHRNQAKELEVETEALALKSAISGSLLNLISTIGYYGCYATVLFKAIGGAMSVGTFGFLTASFSRSSAYIERILSNCNDLTEDLLFLEDLFEFLKLSPSLTSPSRPVPMPRRIRDGIEFQNVSFTYPGCTWPTLKNLNIRLEPGVRVALLGENGAGKTTLVKLLTRLYDPTEGRILLDGIDIRDYDPREVRKETSVIFQDFVKYDLRVRDNVGFGRLECISDDACLHTAARSAYASRLVQELPGHWEQLLGKRFEGGINLSGGEWQKIALSRCYMRNAQIMILDEPTFALDARSEHQVFLQFAARTQDRITLLISHRFSSVRIADRIILISGGTVNEQGTHETLIAKGGRYAQLFALQAAGYR